MRRVLLALAIIVLTGSVGAQAPFGPVQSTPGPVIVAESCAIELTPAVQPNWRAAFSYLATTDNEGDISKLELRANGSQEPKAFIRLDQFESCLRRWQFSGAGLYTVVFTAGTGGDALRHWTVNVSNLQGRFRLVFPRV